MSRRADDLLWNKHKSELRQLVEVESKELPWIIEHMKSKHGLDKTKSQYLRTFKKWGFRRKNISKEQWEYIDYRMSKRESEGRHLSVIKLQGALIPNAKIKKQRRNYVMSTFQRQQMLLGIAPRPLTPPGFEIYTPPALSPQLQPMDLEPAVVADGLGYIPEADLRVAVQRDMQLWSADQTPFRQFLRAFSELKISGAHSNSSVLPSDSLSHSQISEVSLSVFEERVEDLFWTREYINDDSYFVDNFWYLEPLHPAVLDPSPYLLPRDDGNADINIKGRHQLSSIGKQLELLKHIVYLLSNNLHNDDITSTIIEFARDTKNCEFLARFLYQGLYTLEAVAEKLLIPAVDGNSLPLVEILLTADIDVNYWDFDPLCTGQRRYLLVSAIESSNEDLVRLLLERRADPMVSHIVSTYHGPQSFTLLELAIFKGKLAITGCLIRHLEKYEDPMSQPQSPNVLFKDQKGNPISKESYFENAFLTAAYVGNLLILEFLISEKAGIYRQLCKRPWLLFEAAAQGGSLEVLEALKKKGLDYHATEDQYLGSPIVSALAVDNIEIAKYLIEAGFNVDTYISTTFVDIVGRSLENLSGFAPIHLATFRGGVDIVRSLLGKGVSANRAGLMSPIQIASFTGNKKIARLLLDHGADVNFVSMSDDCRHFPEWLGGDLYDNFTSEKSAVQIALENGDMEMFELLRQAGAYLPLEPSCFCTRAKDAFFGRPNIPGYPWNNATRTCENDKDHFHQYTNERIWNPLSNAAIGKNKKLFRNILEVGILEDRPWMTEMCIRQCMKSFDGDFVDELIKTNLFPVSSEVNVKRLSLAVRERSLTTVRSMLQILDPDADVHQNALRKAVQDTNEDLIRIFLELGYWPNARVIKESLLTNCEQMNRVFFDHFQTQTNNAHESHVKDHFVEVYYAYLAHGDPYMLQPFVNALGIDAEVSNELIPTMIFRRVSQIPAIHGAAELGRYDNVTWLLDHGANPDFSRRRGKSHSLLQLATRDQNVSVAKRLVGMGVDVNAKPAKYNGATALQFAAINGHFELANILLDAGADINTPPGYYEGRSAIEGTAEFGRMDMAIYLLHLGASEGLKGKNNINYHRTVFRAWKHGHHALARRIQKWKSENDADYCHDQDSIESILRTMTPESLVFSASCGSEPKAIDFDNVCSLCVPWRRLR